LGGGAVTVFATVGTQLPFDRLLMAVNDWAALNPDVAVQAQTGRTTARLAHMTCAASLDQAAFAAAFATARLIVSHAGMGTILSAAELGKPILLMPRRAAHGEHRNDHQLDTAARMAALPNVTVVHQAADVGPALTRLLARPQTVTPGLSQQATGPLIANLRAFIFSARAGAPQ